MSIMMNSYERFKAVLDHEKPDKLPFYFPTIACSVTSQIMGRQVDSGGDSLHFKEESSWLSGENAHDEFVHQYREDAIELNKKLRADLVRQTWRSRARPSKKLDEYTLLFGEENGPHVIKRFFPHRQSYGVVENTMEPKELEELKKLLVEQMRMDCSTTESDLFSLYKDQLEFKRAAEPYFPTIVGGLGIEIPVHSTVWLEATVQESELLADYFLYTAEIWVKHVRWLHKQGFRWINGGGDLASGQGTIFSPAFFSKAMVPALRKITDACNEVDMFYCFRTDGNIWSISDALFSEAGVQAYGEVDREASMTVGRLRDGYPGLIILGNNSSQLLHLGTEEQVREETRAAILESGGTNYIPGPSNAIMHGTPVENIYAMIDEIEKYKPANL